MRLKFRVSVALVAIAASAVAVSASAASAPYGAPAHPLLLGGDISMLPKLEELGAVYRDEGKPGDAIDIMMRHGCNCFRVRLFVDPAMDGEVVQDLPYVVKLARRIENAGASLFLDIHYSDTWADPGHQSKPAAWSDLDFAGLVERVGSYTAMVMDTLGRAGALPEIVQIGNEITPGFLWPEGSIAAPEGGWARFAALLDAAVRGVREPLDPADEVRIMLHVDAGGSAETTAWFFGTLEKYGVAFDMIGLSYYPWWHGGISGLRDNLRRTAEAFGKEIMVVETAYPWREDVEGAAMAWPQTPLGQKEFLEDVVRAVRSTPGGLGVGVLWWYPEAVPVRGFDVWKDGAAALFDTAGNALPAMDAFREAGKR